MKINTDISVADMAILLGALGYFICPVDAIPDAIPVAGFTDDAAALVAVFKTLSKYITLSSSKAAEDKLNELFKDKDNEALIRAILERAEKNKK